MAIEILNEWEFTKNSIVSTAVSMQMPIVLYYRATKAGVASSEVVIDIVTSVPQTLTLEKPVIIDDDGTYYYYYINLENVLKYYAKTRDVVDSLNFQSSSGGYNSDIMVSGSLSIRTYDASDVLIEDLNTGIIYSHLVNKLPSESGFNLWNAYAMRNIPKYLKFSNDTYNALFAFTLDTLAVYNKTNGEVLNVLSSGQDKYVQVKFEKRIQEVYGKKRYFQYSDIDVIGDPTFSLVVANDIDAARFKCSRVVQEEDNSTESSLWLTIAGTDLLIEKRFLSNDGIRRYFDIYLDDLAGNNNFQIQVTPGFATGGTTVNQSGDDIRFEVEYNNNDGKFVLEPGINSIEIIANDGAADYAFADVEIDFDPYGCYVNLCWMHPQYGYVSYPFEGATIESNENIKIADLQKFLLTMVNANELNENQGYNANEIITLSTHGCSKYYDLLKELYSSRFVYLFVGETGDEDSELNWLSCEVIGNYLINNNRQKNSNEFTVQLRLQKKQTIKF